MRLTHLKLAGFKSFVDPTTLHIHGQRVGVVGPNGCGKSNVMESIRWVLGESSAKEMRGDSMQDVIFNGSSNRKPVARASVELLFDNSLGAAAGEWSQYAEISVKRVLQRDGGSDYYINNTRVRRRDVADLFLGTGLGGRAYAIIGQNTISRIVEAKPEELRVFLEEAAGVSKYKERRRETELRLRDTRENLIRVEDIRGELDKQIAHLESQAEVARRYHALQQSLEQARAHCWLVRKRDAAAAWEKARRQVERQVNELEAQTAQLRGMEATLEALRQEHQAAGDALHIAQGRYYEANAQATSASQQLQHARENRERLQRQLAQLQAEQDRAQAQQQEYGQRLLQLQQQQAAAAEAVQAARATLEQARLALPAAEQAQRDAQAAFAKVQSSIYQAEQQIQLEQTHLAHGRRTLQDIAQRVQRLADEAAHLVAPDPATLQAREAESAALQRRLGDLEAELQQQVGQEQAAAEQVRALQHEVQQLGRDIASQEAQVAALSKLQQALGHEHKLDGWLQQAGIDAGSRLWQGITVEPGWETAVEGVLGARLNAIRHPGSPAPERTRPPATVALYEASAELHVPHSRAGVGRALIACVQATDAEAAGVLADWLAGVYLLEDEASLPQVCAKLRPGESLVSRAGDVYTRHGVVFYAAQSGLHGVLDRQRELEQLAATLPAARQRLLDRESQLQVADQALHGLRSDIARKQHEQRQLTASSHALRLEVQRLQQQLQHARERQEQLTEEQNKLRQQREELEVQLAQREQAVGGWRQEVDIARAERDQAGRLRQDAEATLRQAREGLLEAEREAQKKEFDEKLASNNIKELHDKINTLQEALAGYAVRHGEASQLLLDTATETLQAALEQALQAQQQCERALAAARDALAGVEQRLQQAERDRMQAEQQLHPMRDRLEQSRLQEQQARLGFEQAAEALAATGMDEQGLADALPANVRLAELERRGTSLEAEIAELGPVNLAAIHELASERERKSYLDNQAADLEQAVATLEDAIRRIDRETRSRLQHTFDEANRHFGELFVTLFGGGQAQLQMLGEEILDTGVLVFAQPPGKKNSTIHLLSGGEKALTALALVFALFRLNPAPFCLMDEVDAPLDDTNTERFCALVRKMSERTQFLFVSHNKITMEMAQQLVGVTMQESGVSRIVEVDIEAAMQMQTEMAL